MKKKKLYGLWLLLAALAVCGVLFLNRKADIHSVQYVQTDFRQVHIEEYSGDNSAWQYFVPEGEDTVRCLTLGPLRLEVSGESTEYFVELQYSAADESSVFKIFAADYISQDNSGGKVFVNHAIDMHDSAYKTSFVLDQAVDSVFVTVETTDPAFQLGRVNLRSGEYVYEDTWFLIGITLLLTVALFFVLNGKFRSQGTEILGGRVESRETALLFLLVAAGTVFLSSLPVLDSGIIAGHDTPFHMARIEGMARGLQSGQFPVRIHGGTLNDYGYPNSLFYPELLLYIPAVLRVLGVSVYTGYKVYIVLVNALTYVCSYTAFKRLSQNRFTGITLAVVYTLLPYRLICAYFRSAIGEVTAMAFLPLVAYGLYAVLYGDKKDWGYLVVGATGVLQAHILTTEMTVIFAGLFCLLGIKQLFSREKRILPLIYAAAFTVLINLWLLGPMVLMMLQLGLIVFTRGAVTSSAASADISNLFSLTKLNLIGPHPVGILSVLVLLLYPAARLIFANREKESDNGVQDNLYFNMIFFLVASTALFPWSFVEEIPLLGTVLSSVQFPYRYTAMVQLCSAVLYGSVLQKAPVKKSHRHAANGLVIILAVFSALMMIQNIVGYNNEKIVSKSYYRNWLDGQLAVGQAEYLVEGSDLDAMIADPPVLESDNPSMTISGYTRYGTKMSFRYAMDLSQGEENRIILPVTYIPNYEIMVDGQRVYPTKYTDGGRVAFAVPAAEGSVTVRYTSPLTFRACEVFSLAALAAFALAVYCTKKQVAPLSLLKKKKN